MMVKISAEMLARYTISAVFFVSFVLVEVAPNKLYAFDCRRTGIHDCVHGTCDETTGICQCDSGYQSYDCSHDSSSSGTGCGDKCGPNSFCRSDNTCVCPPTRYNGDKGTCEHKALGYSCSESGKIFINVNFPKVDKFYVYVENKESTCSFKSDGSTRHPAMPTDWQGKVRAVDLPTDPACGTAIIKNTNGVETPCVIVYIRNYMSFTSGLDTVVQFCCTNGLVEAHVGGIKLTEEKTTPLPSTTSPLRISNWVIALHATFIVNSCWYWSM